MSGLLKLHWFWASVLLSFLTACSSDVPEEISDVYGELPDKIDFNFHVRPILSDKCFACHGPDEQAREAKLRLDIEESAFAALSNSDGFAIVKGKPHESAVIARVLSEDAEYKMPPPESEMEMSAREKALLFKWIEQGAAWKAHWAFIPPKMPVIPKVKRQSWCENEIDFFVLEKQQTLGLKPSPTAPKEQWLRRVTYDITGFPPKIAAIEAFLADESENAYEKVVDRLLATTAYGERMASIWLDVARYADSHGYQDDRPRTSWPWRDWVIQSFNRNLSYKDFVTYQLAGDLLPNANYEQKLATGFNRNHAITQEGGVVQEEYLAEYAADRTQTFSTAFLGLTMECARCHSHKYDPISQTEYYSLVSFFNNIPEQGQINYFDLAPVPNMPFEDTLMDSTILAVKKWIAKGESDLAALKVAEKAAFEDWLISKKRGVNFEKDLAEGLIADFQLDDAAHGIFNSKVPNQPKGLMNINLPPHIELPDYVDGKSGKALIFNGANFLSLGEIGDFEWYDAFSFGAWIKHSGKHKKEAGILARRVGEQKRQGYDLILTPNNQLAVRLIHQYEKQTTHWRPNPIHDAIEVRTKKRINPNNWQHVFVTYDGSGKAKGIAIYIDGEKQNLTILMDSLKGKSILNGNDFLVGNWNHRARELKNLWGFDGGVVDEVKIYNRALSTPEVQYLAKKQVKFTKKAWFDYYLKKANKKHQGIQQQLDSLRKIDLEKPTLMIMEEVDTIKPTFVLDRGAYDAPLAEVHRGTPKAVLAFSDEFPNNRLGLANWLFSEKNPLTDRVIVNRFWQLYFGSGLVATPEDFGNQGNIPSHPKLLDYLALRFRQDGRDMKKLVKLMVLSATYRQDASLKNRQQKDPDNLFLTSGPTQRLSAEMLRDQALVTSDLYYEKVGGKWVKPYQPPGIWKELANQIGENKYRPSEGKDLYRRSIYGYWKRTIPPPTMLTFDAAERAACTVKRQQTSTPLQSLVLLNNPIYVEAGRGLATALMQEEIDVEKGIAKAFYKIVSRQPKVAEIDLLKNIYAEEKKRFTNNKNAALQLFEIGASPVNKDLEAASLAALTVVINAIFNLDEAKYR